MKYVVEKSVLVPNVCQERPTSFNLYVYPCPTWCCLIWTAETCSSEINQMCKTYIVVFVV